MKKIIEIIKKKCLRDTTKTIILVVILILAFIGVNTLIQNLDLQDIDVTANKLYTLSEESKNQIKNINQKVTVYLIGFKEDTALSDLLKQYTKQNENITQEIIKDIQDRADIKAKYQITDETQVIIVETEERNKILTVDELYTYDYTTYQQIDVSEQKITNAIVDLTILEKPKVYFLTGHNEYGINTHLTILNAYLVNEVNDVESLDLLVKDTVPEDADALVIGTPAKDFSDREVKIITKYINNGGKILWMNDPELTGKEYPNIQKILDLFGVTLDEGIIIEQDSNKMISETPNFIIPNVSSTNATKNIATDGGVLLINSGKITLADDEKLGELNVNNQTILTTSDKALFRTEVSSTSVSKISSDEEGTFTLASKLTKRINEDTEAVMYIIANNLFATDYPISSGSSQIPAIYFYNNKDLVLNIISELTDRKDTITIRKDTGTVSYTATEQQDRIVKIIIFTIPTVIILAGIIVWQLRRRKK